MKTTKNDARTALAEKSAAMYALNAKILAALAEASARTDANWCHVGDMQAALEGLTAAAFSLGVIDEFEAKKISGVTY